MAEGLGVIGGGVQAGRVEHGKVGPFLPASRLPTSSSMPSARAALTR